MSTDIAADPRDKLRAAIHDCVTRCDLGTAKQGMLPFKKVSEVPEDQIDAVVAKLKALTAEQEEKPLDALKRLSNDIEDINYTFAERTPDGFLEYLKMAAFPYKDWQWVVMGFRAYISSVMYELKTDSLVRKHKDANAVLERICALHGSMVDPGCTFPSTIEQFDDERYAPPGYMWRRTYGGSPDLVKVGGGTPEVRQFLIDFETDRLPTLDTQDITERLIASAKVRAAEEVADATEVEWLARNLIQKGTVALLTAQRKVGKSFLATDLTLALASEERTEWMGVKIVPGQHVLYLNAEGAMSQRLAAYRKHHGALPKKFHTMQLKVKLDTIGMGVLKRQIEAHEEEHGPVDVLVIDPLARALQGSEVSDKDMAAFIDNAESLTGHRTVIVVHHLGKDESAGPRGHSSLSGAVTVEIRLSLDPKTGIRSISVPFVREAEEWEGARFRLLPVELGTDKFGEPLQSAVVERVGGAAKDALPKMGKNQRAVYAALQALAAEVGVPHEDGTVRVPLAVLIERAGTELGVEPKRRSERIRDALTKLEAAVGIDSESAWLIT